MRLGQRLGREGVFGREHASRRWKPSDTERRPIPHRVLRPTAIVKGFGWRPDDDGCHGRGGPASESLQGRNPREAGGTARRGAMGIWVPPVPSGVTLCQRRRSCERSIGCDTVGCLVSRAGVGRGDHGLRACRSALAAERGRRWRRTSARRTQHHAPRVSRDGS